MKAIESRLHLDYRVAPQKLDRLPQDGNVRPGHPAERASWIWHPGRTGQETSFLEFTLAFDWQSTNPLIVHVTADHRFQFFLDETLVGYGTDRCAMENWTVATYQIPGVFVWDGREFEIAPTGEDQEVKP